MKDAEIASPIFSGPARYAQWKCQETIPIHEWHFNNEFAIPLYWNSQHGYILTDGLFHGKKRKGGGNFMEIFTNTNER